MGKTLLITCNKNVSNAKYFSSPEMLEDYLANNEQIETIVFVIWHWKVLNNLLKHYRCIGMHTGPLLQGMGRGPQPIKNLKRLHVKWATVCSFEMTERFDDGEILTAQPISLEGTEVQIYKRINDLLPDLVSYLSQEPYPIPEVWKKVDLFE